MPELPEVETIRKKLIPCIVGKKIIKIDILSTKNFIGKVDDVIGKKVIGLSRIGKYLAIELSGNLFLNIHLKMTGQIFIHKQYKTPETNTRVVFYFDDKSIMFFNDMRKFGYVKVDTKKEKQHFIDVLSQDFTVEYLSLKIGKTKKSIKAFLLDQEVLAGLGNIYVNDALYLAGILPTRITNSLTKREIEKLYKSILLVINEGVRLGGATAKDRGYIQPDGSHGKYQNYFKVYGREGQKCLGCDSKVVRIKQNGRSSFYCPKCQI
jgi:formamidopyrimidine-DNA glycosylase